MEEVKQFIKTVLGYVSNLVFKVNSSPKIKRSDIIFILPYYHVGGAEQVHLDIVKAVAHKKVTVIFTHLSATDHFLPRFRESASIIELNSIINKKSERVRKALFKTIANAVNNSNTVTYIFGCNTDYFYKMLPLFDSSKRRVDLIHAIAPNDSRVPLLASSAKYIDTRVVINRKAKGDLVEIYRDNDIATFADHITIISNGVDLPAIQDYSKDFSDRSIRIGFIGRWSDEKRPWLFLEIAQKIQSDFKNVDFKMAGSGMKGHRDTIEKAGVQYIGAITTAQELVAFYKEIDMIVICSSTEGFPMVLMEAMPYGVLPLCTDVGGISEHILHQNNGLLIADGTETQVVTSFSKQLSDLLDNREELKRLSENAASYAMDHFSIEKFNESYRKLLD